VGGSHNPSQLAKLCGQALGLTSCMCMPKKSSQMTMADPSLSIDSPAMIIVRTGDASSS